MRQFGEIIGETILLKCLCIDDYEVRGWIFKKSNEYWCLYHDNDYLIDIININQCGELTLVKTFNHDDFLKSFKYYTIEEWRDKKIKAVLS